jgi:translation initiation factor IF-1
LKWSEGQGVDVELVDNFNAVGYVVKYLNKVKEMCVVKGDKISIEVIPYDKKSEGVWKAEGVFMIPNSLSNPTRYLMRFSMERFLQLSTLSSPNRFKLCFISIP